MKRSMVLGCALLLCAAIVGCTSDTHAGLLTETIGLMNQASTEVGLIKTRVKEATDKAKGGKIDLSEAMKAADKLKQTGEDANKVKKLIERVRGRVTEEERKENAEKHGRALNQAVEDLWKAKQSLQKQLAEAELISESAKREVERLREKIRDAESPFEALAR